jgi:hypothetical protein
MYMRGAHNDKQGRWNKRPGVLAAIAAAASLALIPASASAAARGSVYGGATFSNVTISVLNDSNMVLDVAGASRADGAPVIQWYRNGGANQRFNIVPDANGWEHIQSVSSGKCLATNGQPGNGITQWPCSNSTQEDWVAPPANFAGYFQNPESGMFFNIPDARRLTAGAQVVASPINSTVDAQSSLFQFTY